MKNKLVELYYEERSGWKTRKCSFSTMSSMEPGSFGRLYKKKVLWANKFEKLSILYLHISPWVTIPLAVACKGSEKSCR